MNSFSSQSSRVGMLVFIIASIRIELIRNSCLSVCLYIFLQIGGYDHLSSLVREHDRDIIDLKYVAIVLLLGLASRHTSY